MKALPFLFREAWLNLRRHSLVTLAAVTTIAAALTLCGAFGLGLYQVQHLLRQTVRSFEVRVFCRQDIPPDTLARTRRRLRALPGVAEVVHIPPGAAFDEATRNLPIDLDGIPNLMPDTFVVKLSGDGRGEAIARAARAWPEAVDRVDLPEEELRAVLRIAGAARTLGLLGAALLLAGALIVVSNTIRLSVFARRQEIHIMRIVGATVLLIRLPLLIEGILHGLGGGALAAAVLLGLARWSQQEIIQSAPLLAANAAPVVAEFLVAAVILAGIGLGAGGSFLSIRRYLRAV